jgi:hypothetical protein
VSCSSRGPSAEDSSVIEPAMRLKWLDRGPYLLLPEKLADRWEGSDPPSGGRVVEADFRWNAEGPATDYDRACDVEDCGLGVLRIGRGEGLVFSTDASTAYYHDTRGRHFLLVWQAAPTETELLDHFHDKFPSLAAEKETQFSHPGGKLIVMCAADVVGKWVFDHDEFDLSRGRYQASLYTSQSEDVSVQVLHLQRRRSWNGIYLCVSLDRGASSPRWRNQPGRISSSGLVGCSAGGASGADLVDDLEAAAARPPKVSCLGTALLENREGPQRRRPPLLRHPGSGQSSTGEP